MNENQSVRFNLKGASRNIVATLSRLSNPPTGKIPYHVFVLGYEERWRKYSPIEETQRKKVEERIKSGSYLIESVTFSDKPLEGKWN